MKQPKYYGLKKFLCEERIRGLSIDFVQTGTESTETYWVLTADSGNKKRVLDRTVKDLVELRPDWSSVLRPRTQVITEIEKWDAFIEEDKVAYNKYLDLKERFES